MKNKITTGSITKDKIFKNQRSWILGHFADPPFNTEHFEIKLAEHKKGEKKEKIAKNNKASTLTFLISGRFLITFYNKEKKIIREELLKERGDYVFYQPGVFHDWEAKENSVMLVVRWPSIKDDQEALKV